MQQNQAFLGKGWSFPPQFFASGAEVAMAGGEEDIRQSLYILLATSMGERTMFSAYGCDLTHYLFEEIDQGLINGLRGMVSDAILNNETRIKVEEVEINTAAEEGLVLIAIDYTVQSTNNRYNLVYPFYLTEAAGQQVAKY